MDWFDEGGSSGSAVDVARVLDGINVVESLVELVTLGALLSMGTTRDGGALAVTITVDGRWRREYVRSSDDLAAFLAEALPAVRDALERVASSAARGNGSRRRRGL